MTGEGWDMDGDGRRVERPGGIEIPYRLVGSGHRGGPRLLFAHALSGSGLLTPAEVFTPFLDRGWTVAGLDQRGHGQATPSTNPEDYRVEEFGADLLAVLDDLAWPSAWLCGGSMGTAAAIAAAATAPERVEGLLLWAPAYGRQRNESADMFAEIAAVLGADGFEAASRAWRQAMRARDVADAAIDQQLAQLQWHDPAAMAVWLRELTAWTIGPELDRLPDLARPVVVLAWEDDGIHPAALGVEVAALGAGACRIVDLATPGIGPTFLAEQTLEVLDQLVGARSV